MILESNETVKKLELEIEKGIVFETIPIINGSINGLIIDTSLVAHTATRRGFGCREKCNLRRAC